MFTQKIRETLPTTEKSFFQSKKKMLLKILNLDNFEVTSPWK